MTYQETLNFMYSSLPMYHRIGKAAYKADIANTVALMKHLGNPELKLRAIHVAGTNGKGSVSHLLASILQQQGYKVGLYTSPHLVDFRERIRINGEMIPEIAVTNFIQDNLQFLTSEELSFFEMTVGMAFDYFVRQQVDVAVVEVGLGGRLDSTNVITPDLSIITNIGFDHTQFLGDTLPKIASEKAGIIKEGVPVVIGETHPATQHVFEAKARELNAPITFADSHYTIRAHPSDSAGMWFDVVCNGTTVGERLQCPLGGAYQLKNLATLMQALEVMHGIGYRLEGEGVRRGIARVVADTGLHGRWEVMAEQPLTICETAHNADGIRSMLEKLSQMSYRQLHIIYGCVNDKDYSTILKMLPQQAIYYYTQPSVPRGLPVDELAATAQQLGMAGTRYPTVAEAITAARRQADNEDLVLITGSIFLVADAVALGCR